MNAHDIQSLIRAETASLSRALQAQTDQTAALTRKVEAMEQQLARNSEKTAKALESVGQVAKVVDVQARQVREWTDPGKRDAERKELLRFIDHQVLKAVEFTLKEASKEPPKERTGRREEAGGLLAEKSRELEVADQLGKIEADFHRIELQFRGELDRVAASVGGLRESLQKVQFQVEKESLGSLTILRHPEVPNFPSKLAFESFVERVSLKLAELGAELWEVKSRLVAGKSKESVDPGPVAPANPPKKSKKRVEEEVGRLKSPPPKEMSGKKRIQSSLKPR